MTALTEARIRGIGQAILEKLDEVDIEDLIDLLQDGNQTNELGEYLDMNFVTEDEDEEESS